MTTQPLSCPACGQAVAQHDLQCSKCGAETTQVGMTLTISQDKRGQLSHTQMFADTVMSLDNDDTVQVDSDSQYSEKQDRQSLPHANDQMAHFKITDILGKGGMGAVYQAKDLTLERYVAIKMFRASTQTSNKTEKETSPGQTQLIEEAKTICRVNHPNIVTIYDIARGQDANFIVMEWVDGRPLNHQIPQKGLPLKIAINYAKQIVAAIACAHKHGIIHHDIKPQNIMVDFDDRIKVLDFGIAELLQHSEQQTSEQSASDQSANQNQSIIGTPQYMAPEQIQGLVTDQRSDLFSLGIVLYEMLSGKKPFLGLNIQQITEAIVTGAHSPLAELKSDLPTSVITLVEKLLQTDPEQRYQDAQTVFEDLEIIDTEINIQYNWWQRQHWLSKAAMIAPLVFVLGWSVKSVVFPPTTQELIERQMVEARKIAILPFDNISGDPVLQIFNDGVASMLSNDLAEAGHTQGDGTTWVIPATEISKMDKPSVKSVSDKYGVDLVLTGSIQHMGSTRSLILSLLNGSDGRQIKSAELTIDAEKLFQAHQQVREKVIELLGWQLPQQLADRFNQRNTKLDGAYKEYVNGRGYLYRFDQAGNTERAIAAFKKAIEIDPEYADAYVGLAESQLRMYVDTKDGRWLERMEETTHRLRYSEHTLVDYLQGELSLKKGNYQLAKELLETAVKKQSNFSASYNALSKAYMALGKTLEAEKCLQDAHIRFPYNNVLLTQLGVFYFHNGNYDKAIQSFKKLADLAPNNRWAYSNISAGYYLKGEINLAIEAVKKSLELHPNADSYSNLGTYYFMLGRYADAVKSYEKMIKLNDKDYIKWGNLADAYKFSGNSKYKTSYLQAIKLAKSALLINPKSNKPNASLSYYLANLDKRDEAIKYGKKIGSNDTGRDNFIVATAYAQLKMISDALEHLKIAMSLS